MTQERTVLKLTGTDRIAFLQGLVTNDVTQLDVAPVYAALLTPQGKFIADFFVVQGDDSILLDVAQSHAAMLFQKLSMYKLRADVQIEDSGLSVSNGLSNGPAGAFADPRHPSLGWRLIHDGTPTVVDITAQRVAQCVPQTGIELTDDSYILEAGFERLNGIDFRKGCYVGQEIAARMKHKTELRKGLRVVNISKDVPIGTDIIANGKVIGQVFSQSGGQAIAYLRFDRMSDDMTAQDADITV